MFLSTSDISTNVLAYFFLGSIHINRFIFLLMGWYFKKYYCLLFSCNTIYLNVFQCHSLACLFNELISGIFPINSAQFFQGTDKLILNFKWKRQSKRISKNILKKNRISNKKCISFNLPTPFLRYVLQY